MQEIQRKSKFDQTPLDTVEKEIVKKYAATGPPDIKKLRAAAKEANKKLPKVGGEDAIGDMTYNNNGYKGEFIKKRALIDQMLIKNQTRDFSYAERKIRFLGEEGAFNSADLAAWYQVWDQTQIEKYKAVQSKKSNSVSEFIKSKFM